MILGSLKITASSIYVNGQMTTDPTIIGNTLLDYLDKSKRNIEDYEEILSNYLKNKKHSKARTRFVILKKIYQIESPFDVDVLYCELNEKDYSITRQTIYNTLNLFIKLGIINKTNSQQSISKRNEFEINFLIRN